MAGGVKKERPKAVSGETIKLVTGCGNLYLIINSVDGKPFELFAHLGKAGGCATCQNEALTRMITLALKYELPLEEIVDELKGLRCPTPHLWPEEERTLSCADAIAQALSSVLNPEGNPI